MGKRGPRPKPSKLKMLAGNPGKRPLNKLEPKPDLINQISAPDCLDEDSAKIWDKIATQLHNIKVLTVIDTNALIRYCQLYSQWLQLQKILEEKGLTYEVNKENKNGDKFVCYIRERPEIKLCLRLNAEITRLEKEFGLTPSSRTDISVTIPIEMDEMKRKLFGD